MCDKGMELLEQGRGRGDVGAWETSLVAAQSAAVVSLLCHLTQHPIQKQREFSFSTGMKKYLRGEGGHWEGGS